MTRVATRMEKPIVMMADKLIGLVVAGVKDRIERKQYPQVIFCLNYLIALRPNDLNRGHVRVEVGRNGEQSSGVIPGDHVVCRELLFNNQKICGTLLNNILSKFVVAKRDVLSYSTVLSVIRRIMSCSNGALHTFRIRKTLTYRTLDVSRSISMMSLPEPQLAKSGATAAAVL